MKYLGSIVIMSNVLNQLNFYSWFIENGVGILSILLVAYIIQKITQKFIEKFIRSVIPQGRLSKEAEKKREDTLIQIANTSIYIIIWTIAFLMALSEAGVDIGPLLAAAGVTGVAIGFGGQYLIKDVISGLFIVIENQYRVGDVVCFDGTCGLVENVTLRMTTLRDLDGTVHHVPHGEIKKVSNLSKTFARVNLNVGVSYSSDLDHVIAVINKVGDDLFNDPVWKDSIISPPKFLRVDEFADSAIVVKILGDVKPLKQWDVAGELRKRIKIAFHKEKIEIPFPQRVVHNPNV